MIDKPLPYNYLLEQKLLGALILYPDQQKEVSNYVKESDFYKPRHREYYKLIKKMYEEGTLLNKDKMDVFLQADELWNKLGGPAYWTEMEISCDEPHNALSLADDLIEYSVRREIIKAAYRISDMAYDVSDLSMLELSNGIKREYETFIAGKIERTRAVRESKIRTIKTIFHDLYNSLLAARKSGNETTGTPTGIYDLDKLIRGLNPKRLYIIAGRPGQGKTSFVLQICDNAAILGKKVLFLTLEMSDTELAGRILSRRNNIPNEKIQTGKVFEKDSQKLFDTIQSIIDSGWNIIDKPGKTLPKIETTIRSEYKIRPFDILAIDYVQLIGGDYRQTRRDVVGEASRLFVNLAKELNVASVLVSQMSRPEKGKERKAPSMHDLKESGDLEQDANAIILIWRPGLYDKSHDVSETEIRIPKNREGKTGYFNMTFQGAFSKFVETKYERDYEEE